MAKKQPTLNDFFDTLTRIADGLENLSAREADRAVPVAVPDTTTAPVKKEKSPASPALPVSAPQSKEESPSITIEALQIQARDFVQAASTSDDAQVRTNQLRGLLIKAGVNAVSELEGEKLQEFADALSAVMSDAS